VQVHRDEGVAAHVGPKPCAGIREEFDCCAHRLKSTLEPIRSLKSATLGLQRLATEVFPKT